MIDITESDCIRAEEIPSTGSSCCYHRSGYRFTTMAGRIYNFVARALRAKQDQTSGENNLVDDENTYDISLAVILAGYAFESYYDPVSGDSKIMIII